MHNINMSDNRKVLNENVAVKIMGWRAVNLDPPIGDMKWMWAHKEGCRDFELQEVLDFSGDLSLAFQVVEKLREKLLSVSIEQSYCSTTKEWAYVVSVYNYDDSDRLSYDYEYDSIEYGHSLPMTICKAALRAVGCE